MGLSQPGLSKQSGDHGQHESVLETSAKPTRREFISFVAVRPDGDAADADIDPDGLEYTARMALESAAIAYILRQEPDWQCTPAGTAGHDLFKSDASGAPCVWCEVKAMTGSLDERPVGLSRTQFAFAQAKGPDAWLYIVERAGGAEANLVRIKNPAGLARIFTFDHGWRAADLPADRVTR